MAKKGYPELKSLYLNETSSDVPTKVSTVNMNNIPVYQQGTMLINETNSLMAIFDTTGKMIAKTKGNYNLHNLPTGVYLVRIGGVKGACKVIKQ